MKIIDEKGRLFTKINVIDFLVILFFLFLAPAFYFGYKIVTKKPMVEATPEKEFIEIETNCQLIKLKPELLKLISVGNKELDENGQTIGEIISLGQSVPYNYEFYIGKEQKIIKEDPVLKQIEAKLKLKAEEKQGKLYYKDREIRIGSHIEFKTNNFILTAIPFEKPAEAPKKEFIEIETNCRLIKLKPELLNLISVGDKELDENGQMVGEIISLGKSDPYMYEFEIGKDQKITKKHPILKQIDARLKLKVEVNQDKPYYKNREVKIGSPLEFETKKYTLLIVPLEEEEKEEVVERIIDLNVTLKDLDDDTLKKISVGDKELDENGNTIAEILSLGKIESSSTPLDLGGGNLVIGEDSNKKQIFTRMRLKCQVKDSDQLYFKSKKIEHNIPLEFKTNKYEITGLFSDTYKEKEGVVERIIDLNVTLKDLDDDTLEKISVGDKELDENGNTIAEILSLGKIESSSTPLDLGGGNLVIGEDSNKKQIFTRMKLKCQVKGSDQLYFKSKKIEHNIPLEFKTNKYEITGFPSETYQGYLKKKWISLQVKFSRLVPEIAKVVQEEDTEKDALGQTIARISSIISNEPALVVTVDESEDKFITLRHPFERDITASLEVLCVEKEGAYYFKNDLAKMGNNIDFNTDSYSISGMIVGIEVK